MKEYLVTGESLPEVYHKALYLLNKHGDLCECRDWSTTQKELSMTMVVINPFKEPMISKCFIGGPEDLQQYTMEMLDGILDFEVEKGLWEYTYHQRYADQYQFIIDELRRNPTSRRAVMDIRDKAADMYSDDPACWQQAQYFIRDGKLHCKVLFRSNDACKATFMNAFALIMLQLRIAGTLGVEVGTYTHRANSFHCYERDFAVLDSYCKRFESAESPDDLAYYYVDEWQEDMAEAIPRILQKVEELETHDIKEDRTAR